MLLSINLHVSVIKTFRLCAVVAWLCAIGASAAETIYIAQTVHGSDTGTDAANAHSIAWFNTAANWDTDNSADGKIGPGDTVRFSGTLTSQAIIQGSGNSTDWITLELLTGAQFSAPAWGSTGAITDPGSLIKYIIITGPMSGAATNPASWTAPQFINTANTNGSASYDASSRFMELVPAEHIVVRNILFTNLYLREPRSATDLGGSGSAIRIQGGIGDIIVSNVAGFQGATAVSLNGSTGTPSAPATNIWIKNSYFYGFSTTVQIGMGNGSVVADSGMMNCTLDGFDIWSGIPMPAQHHCDGFQSITPGRANFATTYFTNLVVAGNIIGPRMGPLIGGVVDSMNAPIFIEDAATAVKVYNNLIVAGTGYGWGNPGITAGTHDTIITNFHGVKSLIANNTILSHDSGTGIAAVNADVFNNIIQKTRAYISQQSSTHWSPSGYWPVSNTNLFFDATGKSTSSAFGVAVGPWAASYSRTRWTNSPATGPADKNLALDMNSLHERNPMLNADGSVQTGSPALSAGMNLTAAGITTDIIGNTRPASGPWTIGAFQGASGGPAPVESPKNLRKLP